MYMEGQKGGSVLPLKMGCIPVMMAEGIYNEHSKPGYCNEYHSYVGVMNVKIPWLWRIL